MVNNKRQMVNGGNNKKTDSVLILRGLKTIVFNRVGKAVYERVLDRQID
jgi:hypothetical protein